MNRREQAIQKAVFDHFRTRSAPGVIAWHTPNGGYRRRTEAAILKGLGVRAGIPDVLALKGSRLFALELKAEGETLSDEQKKTLIALREAGATTSHASSLN